MFPAFGAPRAACIFAMIFSNSAFLPGLILNFTTKVVGAGPRPQPRGACRPGAWALAMPTDTTPSQRVRFRLEIAWWASYGRVAEEKRKLQ